MRVWHHAVGGLCAIFLAGCAYTDAVPVAYDDASTWGVRVYDVKPLLFVYEKNTQIQFVPNYNRAYAVQFGEFLAKNDFKLSLDTGSITQVQTNLDSTDFIKLLSAIAPNLIPPAGLGSSQPAAVNDHLVGIYEFEFDDFGNLVGLRRIYHDKHLPPPPSPPPPPVDHGGGGQNTPPANPKPPVTNKT